MRDMHEMTGFRENTLSDDGVDMGMPVIVSGRTMGNSNAGGRRTRRKTPPRNPCI
jgi:hypothetical protein